MNKPDGGGAFPEAGLSGLPNGEFIHPRGGMSLRDYFAVAALPNVKTTITINVDAHNGGCTVDQIGEAMARGLAHAAYMVADAMIVERDK